MRFILASRTYSKRHTRRWIEMRFVLALSLVLLIGCEPRQDELDAIAKTVGRSHVVEVNYDDCQYIYIRNFPQGGLSHKGNCPNPIHKALGL